jgi:hypothetical protein
LPHPIAIEHTSPYLVEHKREVYERYRPVLLQDVVKLAAGVFAPEVHADEMDGTLGFRGIDINSNNREVPDLGQEAKTEVPGYSGDNYNWFTAFHYCFGGSGFEFGLAAGELGVAG